MRHAFRSALRVGPGAVGRLTIAALGLRATDRDHVHAVRARLEGADHFGRDANDVPLANVLDLVIEAHTAGAGDDDIRLLLLSMLVRRGVAHIGRIPEQAHADIARLEVVPRHADLEPLQAPGGRIVQAEKVHDLPVAHPAGSYRRPYFGPWRCSTSSCRSPARSGTARSRSRARPDGRITRRSWTSWWSAASSGWTATSGPWLRTSCPGAIRCRMSRTRSAPRRDRAARPSP